MHRGAFIVKIFVSYARVDKPLCQQIVERLSNAHEVWYDRRLHAGQAWWDEIVRRLGSQGARGHQDGKARPYHDATKQRPHVRTRFLPNATGLKEGLIPPLQG